MKDYSATISVIIGVRAPNEEKAQERAQEIADRLEVRTDPGKKPYPVWYDADSCEASVQNVTCESE